jgi:NAD(P)H-hydrate epimerase
MLPAMTREELRDVDRRAIEDFGLPGIVLMENAGRGCADLLTSLGIAGTVLICAGKGNNAGDGFVIARHLENSGHDVRVLLFCQPGELRGDALANYRVIESARTPIEVINGDVSASNLESQLAAADWIVDALLGTGTQGQIREPYSTAIEMINQSGQRTFAIDLPSGLDCDTGAPLGCCIIAQHTATFVARKIGFDSADASRYTGKVHVIGIGVPKALFLA